MSISVSVSVPKLSAAGFLIFCRRQGWMEPIEGINRLTTCIDKQSASLVELQPPGRRWVPSPHALWYDLARGSIGYDGDFDTIKKACEKFFHPDDIAKVAEMTELSRKLAYTRGDEYQATNNRLQTLLAEIRSSDEVLLCEGLADARAANIESEIVVVDGQSVLDVLIDDDVTNDLEIGEVLLN